MTEPLWSQELRRRYLKGEACQFMLHGNVDDLLVHEGRWHSLVEYLGRVLLARSKDIIVHYNLSSGVRFLKRTGDVADLETLLLSKARDKVLPALETLLLTHNRVAVIIDYADMLAPVGEASFFSDSDRESVVTLHRWSHATALEHSDNLVLLICEQPTALHPKLTANPRSANLLVPMPDAATRHDAIDLASPGLEAGWRNHLVEVTAGLKAVQIKGLLQPAADGPAEKAEREKFIAQLLQSAPQAQARAAKLAGLTAGMSLEEIRGLMAPEAAPEGAGSPDGHAELLRLILARKREIIERECLGLIEFVTSAHNFSVVGGQDAIKKDLLSIAEHMRAGHTARCPMGLLFTGPMGTGKTFVAEAFANEAGVTAIKLKNFRSKWVGSTEGNLERIFAVAQAIGQVIIIIDEGDRAFGNDDGDSDGGTSARVIGRIKEMMSDTRNRGRIMFILMTNRPDKLDVDIKRAGRLDKKIPFLYPQTQAETQSVLQALLRKHRLSHALQFEPGLLAPLVGYSNAELEAVLLLAYEYADPQPIGAEHLKQAMQDYMPSRDQEMLEYMELAAVFETSNRRMLPEKYAQLGNDALQARFTELRARIGRRR